MKQILKEIGIRALALLAALRPIGAEAISRIKAAIDWCAAGGNFSKEQWEEFRDVIQSFPLWALKLTIAIGVAIYVAQAYVSGKTGVQVDGALPISVDQRLSLEPCFWLAALWLFGTFARVIAKDAFAAYAKIKTGAQIAETYASLQRTKKAKADG